MNNNILLDVDSTVLLNNLIIRATNLVDPSLYADVNVVVNVRDINDLNPQFISVSPNDVTLSESVAPGTLVSTINVIDGDKTSPNNIVQLELQDNGAVADSFYLRQTGTTNVWELRTVKTLSFATVPLHNLTVKASDFGTPSLSSTTTILVFVEEPSTTQMPTTTIVSVTSIGTPSNATNNLPYFQQPFYFYDVNENTAFTFNLSAEDSDTGDVLTFSKESDNSNGHMSLMPFDTRTTTVSLTAIDKDVAPFNSQPVITKISVTDGKASATATLIINIVNVNDRVPIFSESTYKFNLDEGLINIQFGQVLATDLDGLSLTYSLDPTENRFTINPTTGYLQNIVTMSPSNTTFMVYAKDDANNVGIAAVSLTINDVNDKKPVFVKLASIWVVTEGPPSINKTLELQITDADVNYPFNNVDLVFNSNQILANWFSITKLTADMFELRVVKTLDRENPNVIKANPGDLYGTLILNFVAYDNLGQAGAQTTTAQLTVAIEDIDDNPVIMNPSTYTVFVADGQSIGYKVVQIMILDLDAISNSLLYFNMSISVSGSIITLPQSAQDFTINPTSDTKI